MKIAAMAAGAVGGYFGARMQAAGHDVFFIARGANIAAMQANGLKLESVHGDLHLPKPNATDDPGVSAGVTRQDGGGDVAGGIVGVRVVAAWASAAERLAVQRTVLCSFAGLGVGKHLVSVQPRHTRTHDPHGRACFPVGRGRLGAVVLSVQGTGAD